jgi:hypothetical protein
MGAQGAERAYRPTLQRTKQGRGPGCGPSSRWPLTRRHLQRSLYATVGRPNSWPPPAESADWRPARVATRPAASGWHRWPADAPPPGRLAQTPLTCTASPRRPATAQPGRGPAAGDQQPFQDEWARLEPDRRPGSAVDVAGGPWPGPELSHQRERSWHSARRRHLPSADLSAVQQAQCRE